MTEYHFMNNKELFFGCFRSQKSVILEVYWGCYKEKSFDSGSNYEDNHKSAVKNKHFVSL